MNGHSLVTGGNDACLSLWGWSKPGEDLSLRHRTDESLANLSYNPNDYNEI